MGRLYCPEGKHEVKVRFNPSPGERFCPEHRVPLRNLAKAGGTQPREGLPGEKQARSRFAQVVKERPCFFLDRIDGEPRRPGHVCRYPLDAHHILPKSFLRHELSLEPEELVALLWNPLVGAPLCRAAHDAVERGSDRIYWEELNPDLIALCERFDAERPEQRSLVQRLETECPRRRWAASASASTDSGFASSLSDRPELPKETTQAMNINRVILTGNLTRDPELRSTTGGTSVCELGLAVNGREKINGEWTERPDFFNVTVWGATAENVAKYLHKGSPVAIDGRLRFESWEKDGEKRSAVKVVAQTVQFLGSKSDGDGSTAEPAASGGGDEDIPF